PGDLAEAGAEHPVSELVVDGAGAGDEVGRLPEVAEHRLQSRPRAGHVRLEEQVAPGGGDELRAAGGGLVGPRGAVEEGGAEEVDDARALARVARPRRVLEPALGRLERLLETARAAGDACAP